MIHTKVGRPFQHWFPELHDLVLLLRVAACGPLYALVESVVERDLDGGDEQGFARAPDPDELEPVPESRDPVDLSGADRVRAELEPALKVVAEPDQVQLVPEPDRDVQDETEKDEDAREVKQSTGVVPHEADYRFRQDARAGEVGEGPEGEVDGERGGEDRWGMRTRSGPARAAADETKMAVVWWLKNGNLTAERPGK